MHKSANKQQGGTVLGLIIGLIIGLGIAVAVALAITKTSLPFTNKAQKPEKAAELSAREFDPNKALYGNREPAREAAKAFVKEKEAEAKPAEDAPTVKAAAFEPKAAVEKARKADAPEAKDSAEAKPAKAEAKAAKEGEAKSEAAKAEADAKTIYFLQAGAFRDQGDAEGLRAKLALMGFEARISERASENGTLYRVRIGPINQADAMNRTRTKLTENGFEPAVIRSAAK